MSDARAAKQGRTSDLSVNGSATPEEVAAITAVLSRATGTRSEDPYQRWRRTRLAALRTGTAPA